MQESFCWWRCSVTISLPTSQSWNFCPCQYLDFGGNSAWNKFNQTKLNEPCVTKIEEKNSACTKTAVKYYIKQGNICVVNHAVRKIKQSPCYRCRCTMHNIITYKLHVKGTLGYWNKFQHDKIQLQPLAASSDMTLETMQACYSPKQTKNKSKKVGVDGEGS